MHLTAGAKLGPYEITAPIGAGGMGVVYRAHDARVGRDVAIKVSAGHFSDRFEREARAVAALNHPNICTLYDVGPDYLVMELIDGESPTGPLPPATARDYARQIALALDVAHEQGIVHRDLKPANIRIRRDGTVKVLDFGLAKIATATSSAADPDSSPTMTGTGTQAGMILGTASYMSPEQARGGPVDKRTDIWAFGVVLYEMVTGRRPFDGADVPTILAAVLQSDPPWDDVPADLQRLLRACLEKDPRKRLRDIGDVWRLLDDPTAATPAKSSRWIGGVAAVAALAAVAIALWAPWRAAPPPAAASLIRLDIDLGPDVVLQPLVAPAFTSLIISPDGRRLVFVGSLAGSPLRLYSRRLDESSITEIAGTQGALSPFFSPDGQWVAFWNGSRLSKVPVDGGAVVPLAALSVMTGGSWDEHAGLIVGSGGLSNSAGLLRIPADGGTPTPILKLDEGEMFHTHPHVVPGRRLVLIAAVATPPAIETTRIEVVSLDDGRRKTIVRGATAPHYLPSGHLLYSGLDGVSIVPFDLDTLETRGAARRILPDVLLDTVTRGAQLDLARDGTLVYRKGLGAAVTPMHVQWVDETGAQTPLARPGSYAQPARLSPDGRRAAIPIKDGSGQDIWVYDLQRDTLTRLTSGGLLYSDPVWTPDGRYIVVGTTGGGLRWMRADGSGQPQALFDNKIPSLQFPSSFSGDGRRLLFHNIGASPAYPQLWTVEIENAGGTLTPRAPEPFLQSSSQDSNGVFSPDGRWIAYQSNESGRFEIFVRPFPAASSGAGGKVQISNSGGWQPLWTPNGRDLLYQVGNQVMAVAYKVNGDVFVADRPRVWAANLNGLSGFGIAPDGRRIAATLPASEGAASRLSNRIVFVQNFLADLRAGTSAGR